MRILTLPRESMPRESMPRENTRPGWGNFMGARVWFGLKFLLLALACQDTRALMCQAMYND